MFPDFRVIPVQAIGTAQVRPRVKMVLPVDAGRTIEAGELIADAFEVSLPIRHSRECESLKREHPDWTLGQIAQRVGISKKVVCDALKFAARVRAASAPDPFIELSERPERAARWRKTSDVIDPI
jgi:hypothetical protein